MTNSTHIEPFLGTNATPQPDLFTTTLPDKPNSRSNISSGVKGGDVASPLAESIVQRFGGVGFLFVEQGRWYPPTIRAQSLLRFPWQESRDSATAPHKSNNGTTHHEHPLVFTRGLPRTGAPAQHIPNQRLGHAMNRKGVVP